MERIFSSRRNERRKTRQVWVGTVCIGGNAPVSIQSMTTTDTRNASETLVQIGRLADAGCNIVRLAVPDQAAVRSLPAIIEASPVPLVADIHFDYRLALGALHAGIHGLRLNPGNLKEPGRVAEIAELAGEKKVPIRVGANSGSVPEERFRQQLDRGCGRCETMARAMIDLALEQCRILENFGFREIKVSLKASDVPTTVQACRIFGSETDYPLHLGVTEAGTPRRGIVKSAVGIGSLLLDGIGDTIRVSLTGDPVEEVKAAVLILESAGIREAEPEIISCPTCGRTQVNLIEIAEKVEEMVLKIKRDHRRIPVRKIAVMGCSVNGPGEARDADLALTGSIDGRLFLYRKGSECGLFSVPDALAEIERILRWEISTTSVEQD